MKKLLLLCCLYLILIPLFSQSPELRGEIYEADYIPWSGYWWPTIHGGLVTGIDYRRHPAPIEKYDYVTSGIFNGPASEYVREHHYDRDAPLWGGLCFCWSAASILEEEPVHKGVYKGTAFRVGDKKGLLTAAYIGTLYTRYSTDTPEEFHGVLEKFIADQKIPIIIDLGTGGEVWNYPVFKYETVYTEEGNRRHYTTLIHYVTDQVRPDYIGSQVQKSLFFYYFDLDPDGNIIESGWEHDTIPPTKATEPLGTEPSVTGLDYDIVKEIVNTVDDPFEENDTMEWPADLPNGRYTMVAIDNDYFEFELKNGGSLTVRAEPEEDQYALIEVDTYLRTYAPDGELIEETQGVGSHTISADETGEGIYIVEIEPLKAAAEPIYKLFVDHRLAYQGILPVYPLGTWQSGIALLSPHGMSGFRSDRIFFSLMDNEAFPQTTYRYMPAPLHFTGMFEDIGFALGSGNEYIRVDADKEFRGLQTMTAGDALMLGSNMIFLDQAASEIFFPFFKRIGGWNTYFGVINIGNQEEEVFRKSYDENGSVVASDIITMAPYEKMETDTFSIPILLGGTESMSLSTSSERDSLIAYIRLMNASPGSRGRSLTPITQARIGTLVIPHVASDEQWRTTIAIMNTGPEDSDVTFSAYNSEGDLTDISVQVLKSKQNLVAQTPEIFPDTPEDEITSIKIRSENDQPLSGIFLYETTDEIRMAGIPIRPARSSELSLPHIACDPFWWTGIGVMNAGDSWTDVSFSLFNEYGYVLDSVTRELNPNQRMAEVVRNLFDDESLSLARYMKIRSLNDQPLSGVYLFGTNDGLRLMGDEL